MTAGDPRIRREGAIPGAGVLGMRIFLATLGMLFAAAIVGFVLVRTRGTGAPAGPPMPLPAGMWVATAVLLLGSVVIRRSLRAIRAGGVRACVRGLAVTLALSIAFLAVQAWNWRRLIGRGFSARSSLEAFTFFMLTGLHAAHVVGGVVLLSIVFVRARAAAYDAERHGGVRYASMYWHFLDVVWLALFAVLGASRI